MEIIEIVDGYYLPQFERIFRNAELEEMAEFLRGEGIDPFEEYPFTFADLMD